MEIPVLYEDNHLLVVDKPPGILSQSDGTGSPDLISECRRYIKEKYNKPGNVYLGLVHRLDRGTAGVMVFARTSKAASRLSRQFRERKVEKTYHALVEGRMLPPEGLLEDHIVKDESRRVALPARPGEPGARLARLKYRTIRHQGEFSLVEVELFTGRFHQIRFQFSRRGFPLFGDQKYGSNRRDPGAFPALRACRIGIFHPVTGEKMDFWSPAPPGWPFQKK